MTRTPEQILCCPGGCEAGDPENCGTVPATVQWVQLRHAPTPDRLTLARAIAPDGWVVVQRIATKEQILAGIGALNEGRAYRNEPPLHAQHNVADVAAIFDAMLAAAQEETT